MHRLLSLAVVLFVFMSCKNTTQQTTITGAGQPLSLNSLYTFDSVVTYLRQVHASQEDTGKKIFLKAVDLFKNKKDAAASLAVFESSLSFYPNNKGYYELGNALLELNKDSLAYRAFDMAEKLNYNPLGYVLFKKACAIAGGLSDDDYEGRQKALDYLQYAIENGFVDRDKVYNEPKLATLRKSGELNFTYNEAMSGNGDPAGILWEGYSSSFKQCSFPMTINMQSLATIKSPAVIGYDYEKYVTEMRDYKFSRDVGNEFFYYAKVASGPAFETVVYGSRSYDYAENLPYIPARFYIASYNKEGKLLDKIEFAGQEAFDQLFKVAVLQQNLNFEVREYKNTWAKPTGENGYENNSVAKSDLIKTIKYKIGTDGKFVSDAQIMSFVPVPGTTNLQ